MHQAKQCRNPTCDEQDTIWKSAQWQQIAPHNISYRYNVIAQIGWWRQQEKQQFQQIYWSLANFKTPMPAIYSLLRVDY